MSVLPAEVNAQLAQLLQQLQSADNNVRSQAEDVLQNQWTSQRPEWLLMGLAEQIGTSTSSPVRRSTPAQPSAGRNTNPSLASCGPSLRSSFAG
jgi:hypothetical protein